MSNEKIEIETPSTEEMAKFSKNETTKAVDEIFSDSAKTEEELEKSYLEKITQERKEIRAKFTEKFVGKSELEMRVIEGEIREDEGLFDTLQEMEKEQIISDFVAMRRGLIDHEKARVSEVIKESRKLNALIDKVYYRLNHQYGPIRNIFWKILVLLGF